MTVKMQVAIDGPASAGKSTIAKILATNFEYIYVDTGAMYRTITLAALRAKIIHPNNEVIKEDQLEKILNETKITFVPSKDGQAVFLNSDDVTHEIRSSVVNGLVSLIAANKLVRSDLVNRQRKIALENSVVMDGRDIGTTVLPDAQVKIFLIASVKERANRRFKENQEKGIDVDLTLKDIEDSIERRDYLDSHREVSPLRQAKDAILVDTTGLNIQQVVDKITNIITNLKK